MRAGSVAGPPRVLVVWCPEWPEETSGDSAEARAFAQVVAVVEEFCPHVEVVRPGLCVLGVRGPARYFGGEDVLARKIADAVARHGAACRAGVADGLFAAGLAARAADLTANQATARGGCGAAVAPVAPDDPFVVVPPGGTRQFLAPYPVHALGHPELAGQLARLGIRTLGDFAGLPGRDVASRFGAEGTAAQRIARGLEARPLAAGPPPADLSAVGEFDPQAELAEQVVFAAKGLAEQMLAGLTARGLTCQRVRVEVVREDGTENGRLWRHEGLLSALAVAQRVRWQLDGWAPARAGGASAGSQRGEHSAGSTARESPAQRMRAPRRAGSRCCAWSRTSWCPTRGASSACGAMSWSATGWSGPRSGCRPCSGTRR